MVPDLMLSLSNPAGRKENRFAELKVINCCLSCYPPGRRKKADDQRAYLLQNEYCRKATDADRIYGRHSVDDIGPIERKLMQFGDVVGAFGECSEDMHYLVQNIAESRANALGQNWV